MSGNVVMKRREFIALASASAAAWPLAADAQQSTTPLIGFLNSQSPEMFVDPLRGFRQGLKDAGFVEGENVAVEYRWAENQNEQLPTLAASLIARKVAVIAAMSTSAALAAKAATSAIPIVFNVGDDPIRSGLVNSLARPGGNLTGVNFLTAELTAKRLELLHELVPEAKRLAVILNPSISISEAVARDVASAADSKGLRVQTFHATTATELNAAFANLAREKPDALFVGPGPFFNARRVQLAQLAARYMIPAVYPTRQYVDVGGLISYGASNSDAWQQAGVMIGRILKGAKPSDLPVMQSAKFELAINAETARILGLTVPPSLLSRADEVIQ
jgi:ABC-type uncharacterized transport system substrate-binding protein